MSCVLPLKYMEFKGVSLCEPALIRGLQSCRVPFTSGSLSTVTFSVSELLSRVQLAPLSHRDKQTEIYSLHVWCESRLDVGVNLGFKFLNSQYSRNSQGRCCWVKNWAGGAEIRKIFRWVWGLWEGFWLRLEVGECRGGLRRVKSFNYTSSPAWHTATKEGEGQLGWISLIYLRWGSSSLRDIRIFLRNLVILKWFSHRFDENVFLLLSEDTVQLIVKRLLC